MTTFRLLSTRISILPSFGFETTSRVFPFCRSTLIRSNRLNSVTSELLLVEKSFNWTTAPYLLKGPYLLPLLKNREPSKGAFLSAIEASRHLANCNPTDAMESLFLLNHSMLVSPVNVPSSCSHLPFRNRSKLSRRSSC